MNCAPATPSKSDDLEREIGHLRDQATASRLDGDVKEQELTGLRAEIEAMAADIADYEDRLDTLLEQLHEAEHESAERAGTIRALQYEIGREEERRTRIESALNEASELARQRWIEVERLFADNAELRALAARANAAGAAESLIAQRPEPPREFIGPPRAPASTSAAAGYVADETPSESGRAAHEIAEASGTAETLQTALLAKGAVNGERPPAPGPTGSQMPADPTAAKDDLMNGTGSIAASSDDPAATNPEDANASTDETARIRQIANQVNRIAGEAAADLFKVFRRQKREPKKSDGETADSGERHAGGIHTDVTDLSAEREARRKLPSRKSGAAAEAQLMSAVEEIKALRQASNSRPVSRDTRSDPPRDAQAGE